MPCLFRRDADNADLAPLYLPNVLSTESVVIYMSSIVELFNELIDSGSD